MRGLFLMLLLAGCHCFAQTPELQYALFPDWFGTATEKGHDLNELPFRLRLVSPNLTLIDVRESVVDNKLLLYPKLQSINMKRPGEKDFEVVLAMAEPITDLTRPRVVNSDDNLVLTYKMSDFFKHASTPENGEFACKVRLQTYRFDSEKRRFVHGPLLSSPPFHLTFKDGRLVDARVDPGSMDTEPIGGLNYKERLGVLPKWDSGR